MICVTNVNVFIYYLLLPHFINVQLRMHSLNTVHLKLRWSVLLDAINVTGTGSSWTVCSTFKHL